MLSPAKASYQRKLAAQAAGPAPASGAAPMPSEGPVASEYQLLLAALGMDLNALRQIQSTDRKIEAKRAMIGKYLAWVRGALDGDVGAQDEIIGNMLVWLIDLALWPDALTLAAYVLRHGIALPQRFNRKPATLIAEEVAEAALAKTPLIGLDDLQGFARLVAAEDMHDQVRAKLEKAQGLAFLRRAEAFDPTAETAVAGGRGALVETALGHFGEALRLDASSGVKKLIETCERELKKLRAPDPQIAGQ